MVLFLDAMKRQSRLFRLAMPAAYLMYVLTQYILFGFVYSPTPVMPSDTNSTGAMHSAVHGVAAAATFEGQISQSLSTLGFLMLSFLKNVFEDALRAIMDDGCVFGSAIAFPMKIATVMKNTVPLLLEGGGEMKTEVNEELRQVVLVPDEIFDASRRQSEQAMSQLRSPDSRNEDEAAGLQTSTMPRRVHDQMLTK